jgi:hypothetical protein
VCPTDSVTASVALMAGAIAIVVVLLIFPTLILISGGLASAILGYFLQRDGEIRNEGSEFLALDD